MNRVRYVIWDDGKAIPALLATEYDSVCSRNGFLLLKRKFDLPDDARRG